MKISPHALEAIASIRAPELVASLLDVDLDRLDVSPPQARDLGFDLAIKAPQATLALEIISNPVRQKLLSKWERLQHAARKHRVPVLVVPFMAEAMRAWCAEHEINWLDLSGNAHIRARGLLIKVEGHAAPHAPSGRPSSVFERRSSRVARLLLREPDRSWSTLECAEATGLDGGHVSRILNRLLSDELLLRDEHKRFMVRDPGALLETWRNAADFSKHHVIKGHIAARSGPELLKQLSQRLDDAKLGHAATGLSAAWSYDHFAMFRLTTVYLRAMPTSAQLHHLHFTESASGANTWLVLPNDDGVFDGMKTVEGTACVHPVQVYVDLKDQPERAEEAAEHLLQQTLHFGSAR